MADITQKDFQSLLKAQQQTTEMLRQSMLTAEEREAERLAAEERFRVRSEAQQARREREALEAANKNAENQEKTEQAVEESGSIFGKFVTFMRGNRAENAEIKEETTRDGEKNRSLLGKIAGGINTLKENALDSAKKAGKTGLAILKGIAFGALLYAFGEFLQSEQFAKITSYIKDTLLPKLSEFYNKFFGEEGGFLSGISSLFGDDSGIGAVVIALTGATALLGASKLAKVFGPLKAGIGTLLSGLGGITKRLPKINLPGFGKKGGVADAAGGSGTKKGPGLLQRTGSKIAGTAKGIGAGIGGMVKGMAGGLAALANPATLIGLAAVVLAINGIAAAVRIASPAFEPFGKLLESAGETIRSVFEGLGSTIESIGNSVKGIIGSIADGITNILTKISEARTAGVRAKTEQIQQLSSIDPGTIESTARGITMMKNALEGFGSESFGNVIKGLISDGPVGDILKLAEKHEILNKAANAVMAITASGMSYKQIMDEEKRQSRMAELEKKTAGGTRTIAGIGYTADDLAADQAELAKLRAQGPAPELEMLRDTAGQRTRASMQGMLTADPRVEAMITSAINKSKLATAPVVNNVVTNNTDARNQSQNTQQSSGAPLTNAKYPRLAYGQSRDF